jgi:hypothetical protein
MTDIPEDIMRAARDACEGYFVDPVSRGTAVSCVALAIAAERERCAKVADAFPKRRAPPGVGQHDLLIGQHTGELVACGYIAAAIRKGEQ